MSVTVVLEQCCPSLTMMALRESLLILAAISCALSKPERNYCVTWCKLLAAVHFTHLFWQQQLTLRTGHCFLSWLRNFREPEGQLARWLEQLQEYTFSVVHRPGKCHGNADALSRLPSCLCCLQQPNPEPSYLVVSRVSLTCGYSQDDSGEAQLEYLVVGPIPYIKDKNR